MARGTGNAAAFFVATLILWSVSVVFEIAFNRRRELLAVVAGCFFYQAANWVIRHSLSRDPLFVNTSVSLLHSTITSLSGPFFLFFILILVLVFFFFRKLSFPTCSIDNSKWVFFLLDWGCGIGNWVSFDLSLWNEI